MAIVATRRIGVGTGLTVAGAASLGVRAVLDGPRQPARVIAAFPTAIYIELRPSHQPEPHVLALVSPGAVRLPNAVVITPAPGRGPAATHSLLAAIGVGDDAVVGEGAIDAGRLHTQVRRWWDPSPVLGPLSRARLDRGATAVARVCATASRPPGLHGHEGPATLAACCAAGDLAGAVETAECLVGLGPGLTPSGDDVIAGLLLALRLLGGAVPGGTTAVWLADWLGAAVTSDAGARTTSLAATLLHCAARGQAAAEVSAVLRGIAGQEPIEPAVRRLLAAGHTSGADLAWGLLAGCRSALKLSDPAIQDATAGDGKNWAATAGQPNGAAGTGPQVKSSRGPDPFLAASEEW